jgi:hypothetical protein
MAFFLGLLQPLGINLGENPFNAIQNYNNYFNAIEKYVFSLISPVLIFSPLDAIAV